MGAPDAQRQARERAARDKAALPSLAGLASQQAAVLALGRSVYEGSCASCHDAGRGLSSSTALQLPLAVALYLPDARNLVHIVREGIQPPGGGAGRWMPPFDGALSDEELAALVTWLRAQAPGTQPWQDIAQAVQDTKGAP
jgi:mono/diheme cytochrome c family protein